MQQNPSSARLTESEDRGGRPVDPSVLARSIILRQLTGSPKSRHQLAVKLAERGIPDEVAADVLDRFEEIQLIDDAEFAHMWVRSRVASKSLARSALRRELADKGITAEHAEAALAGHSDDEEAAAAAALIRRRLGPGTPVGNRAGRDKITRRLVGVLARKGYSPGLSFRVVQTVLDEAALPQGDTDRPAE